MHITVAFLFQFALLNDRPSRGIMFILVLGQVPSLACVDIYLFFKLASVDPVIKNVLWLRCWNGVLYLSNGMIIDQLYIDDWSNNHKRKTRRIIEGKGLG